MQGSAEQDGAAFEILRRLGSSRNFATALFPFLFLTEPPGILPLKIKGSAEALPFLILNSEKSR
jgi:hypothetical protein